MLISAINYASVALYVKGADTREGRKNTGRVRVQSRREVLFSTIAAVQISDSRTELLKSKLIICSVYILVFHHYFLASGSCFKTLEMLFVRVFKEIRREQGEK